MPVTLCVLLWENDGLGDALSAFEDAVLALVPEHGGRVLQRVRREPSPDGVRGDQPLEVQVIELPDDDALAAYMADPRRTGRAAERDRAVARTEVLRVEAVLQP